MNEEFLPRIMSEFSKFFDSDEFIGIEFGKKFIDGDVTEQDCIVFFVKNKIQKELLPSDKILPSSVKINGKTFYTDIREFKDGLHTAGTQCIRTSSLCNSNFVDPKLRVEGECGDSAFDSNLNVPLRALVPGQQITNFGVGTGTMGGIFVDTITRNLVGLTNSHVLGIGVWESILNTDGFRRGHPNTPRPGFATDCPTASTHTQNASRYFNQNINNLVIGTFCQDTFGSSRHSAFGGNRGLRPLWTGTNNPLDQSNNANFDHGHVIGRYLRHVPLRYLSSQERSNYIANPVGNSANVSLADSALFHITNLRRAYRINNRRRTDEFVNLNNLWRGTPAEQENPNGWVPFATTSEINSLTQSIRPVFIVGARCFQRGSGTLNARNIQFTSTNAFFNVSGFLMGNLLDFTYQRSGNEPLGSIPCVVNSGDSGSVIMVRFGGEYPWKIVGLVMGSGACCPSTSTNQACKDARAIGIACRIDVVASLLKIEPYFGQSLSNQNRRIVQTRVVSGRRSRLSFQQNNRTFFLSGFVRNTNQLTAAENQIIQNIIP